MRKILWWMALLTLSARAGYAEPVSPKLALVGITTLAAGAGMLASYGDEYRVLGTTYCLNTAGRSLDRGHCEEPTPGVVTAGKWMLAAGAGMTLAGFWPKRVTVAPMISTRVKGIAGRVQW